MVLPFISLPKILSLNMPVHPCEIKICEGKINDQRLEKFSPIYFI